MSSSDGEGAPWLARHPDARWAMEAFYIQGGQPFEDVSALIGLMLPPECLSGDCDCSEPSPSSLQSLTDPAQALRAFCALTAFCAFGLPPPPCPDDPSCWTTVPCLIWWWAPRLRAQAACLLVATVTSSGHAGRRRTSSCTSRCSTCDPSIWGRTRRGSRDGRTSPAHGQKCLKLQIVLR